VPNQVSVVVVDDEQALVSLVARYLESEGYIVHAAADGHQILEVSVAPCGCG
jgi:CheY-like chemotaxis protein